ncbi:MAG: glycosyltransferase family 4 protein [Methanobrevibacter sp.]|jgi:glycosyltransferase involved in cell wall biosynthesis|nr:glycosyltransferase family 4 protein [Candidatus Methanoflexus mossambicus]
MKIAMIGQYPPHIGGVSSHINRLSASLVENKDEVFVITYQHKNINKKEFIDENGVHVITPFGINIGGLRAIFFIIFATISLIKTVKKYNVDIIHGHFLFPAGLVAILGGFFTKRKVYLTAHGSDILIQYKKHKLLRPVIKFILKHADEILAVSNDLKEEIIKINVPNIESKTHLYLNTVDIDKFKEYNKKQDKKSNINSKIESNIESNIKSNIFKEFNISNNQPTIIFVGNLVKVKNLFNLLKAKKLMKNDANLLIVGDGQLSTKLKEFTSKNNIKNVIFTGSRNDVDKILPMIDLLVLPSISESFGLVILEALACGKPVIGSNIGGIREIITEDVGILIDPNNPQEIANAIDLILNNKNLREKFKKHARARAIEFSKVKIPYNLD